MELFTLEKSTDFKLPMGILGASFSEDGKSIVAACMDGVYLADVESKQAEKIGEHTSYASSAAFLPEHNALVSAGYDGAIQWFDAETKTSLRTINLHEFWSWDMAVSNDQSMIASVTGQYLAGGYKYEPLPEREPSVRLLSADSGEEIHSLEHVPSVQAVAFSDDNKHVAAGNLMGEVRVWNCESGALVANWTTSAFTSWGIIKSHCYLGGIFALKFTPSGDEILLAGMGPMRDPMAGNGKQLWQKWRWNGSEPSLSDQTHDGEAGEGLMETLAIHPSGAAFVMGGRLRGGDWNVAAFDMKTGDRKSILKTGFRVTEAVFNKDGDKLLIVGAQGQPNRNKEGNFGDFGRIEIYEVSMEQGES